MIKKMINENKLYKNLEAFDKKMRNEWSGSSASPKDRFFHSISSNITVNSLALLLARHLKVDSASLRASWIRSIVESVALIEMEKRGDIDSKAYELFAIQTTIDEANAFSVFLDNNGDQEECEIARKLIEVRDRNLTESGITTSSKKFNRTTFFLNPDNPPSPASLVAKYRPNEYEAYNELGLYIHPIFLPEIYLNLKLRVDEYEEAVLSYVKDWLISLNEFHNQPLVKSLNSDGNDYLDLMSEFNGRWPFLRDYLLLLPNDHFGDEVSKSFLTQEDPKAYCFLSFLGRIGLYEPAISGYKSLIEMKATVFPIMSQGEEHKEAYFLLFKIWSIRQMTGHCGQPNESGLRLTALLEQVGDELAPSIIAQKRKDTIVSRGKFYISDDGSVSYDSLVKDYLRKTIKDDDLFGSHYSSYRFSISTEHGFGFSYDEHQDNLGLIFLDIDNWIDETWLNEMTDEAVASNDDDIAKIAYCWGLQIKEKMITENYSKKLFIKSTLQRTVS